MKKILALALALLAATVPAAFAQIATGNIYGAVADESGAVLPGATVTLSGVTGTRSTISGAQGDFRFLNVDNGRHKVTVALTGFTTVIREVIVTTGQNVNLAFGLKVATVEESITVTAETPVVDTKRVGTSTTLTREELHQVPTSRDPWAVLRTIPGVILDRVNIAGNESGQQSQFLGKGADGDDNTWNMDGIMITDMSAIGASPTYFDYDAFQEISVTTGGNDLKVATGGVGLNFVTKRGTNDFHGSARFLITHDDLQSGNLPPELEGDPRLKGSDKADHIQQISDYGVDLGGPIVKDRLWFYAGYGKQDVRNVRLNQTADKTLLPSYNVKLNWQVASNTMFSAFHFIGKKEKFGRGVGYVANEPDSFLWDQGGYYPDGPHGLWKAELNHTFSPNFVMNAKYAYYGTGFSLSPRGDGPGGVNFETNTAVGSYLFYGSKRPQHTVNVDGNYFVSGMGGNHELKFGFGYRKVGVDSTSAFNDTKLFAVKYDSSGGYAYVTRDRAFKAEGKYLSFYLGDTFTKDRLTLNVGARFDQQKANNLPSSAAANPTFPELLGALEFDGSGTGAEWTDISPRVGLTWALTESRRTVLRASYARYAGQLATGDGTYDNPNTGYGYLAYLWADTNGDGLAQKPELLIDQGVQYAGPGDPRNPVSTNEVDPDYESNKDNEFIVGIEHELSPNMAVSAAYTYRNTSSLDWSPRIGFTSANYTANAPVTRNGFTGQTYSPNSALVAATGNGRIRTNRNDYSRTYNGLEATFMKRLSNRWMARVAFTYQSHVENIEGPGAVQNPTRTTRSGGFTSGAQVDGGQFAPPTGGSGKGNIYTNAKWQVVANALWQLPADFELAGAFIGRQGNPRPILLRLGAGADGTQNAIGVPELDTERHPDLYNLDLRLAKNVRLGATTLVLSAELFNVFNNNVVLYQNFTASGTTFNRFEEILSPRIVRFGVRYTF